MCPYNWVLIHPVPTNQCNLPSPNHFEYIPGSQPLARNSYLGAGGLFDYPPYFWYRSVAFREMECDRVVRKSCNEAGGTSQKVVFQCSVHFDCRFPWEFERCQLLVALIGRLHFVIIRSCLVVPSHCKLSPQYIPLLELVTFHTPRTVCTYLGLKLIITGRAFD